MISAPQLRTKIVRVGGNDMRLHREIGMYPDCLLGIGPRLPKVGVPQPVIARHIRLLTERGLAIWSQVRWNPDMAHLAKSQMNTHGDLDTVVIEHQYGRAFTTCCLRRSSYREVVQQTYTSRNTLGCNDQSCHEWGGPAMCA